MLKALINKPQFEYDIHSLIKAFYPGEDVKVWCEETTAPKKEEDGENGGEAVGIGGVFYFYGCVYGDLQGL